jgi:ParB family chromosome partitioning protein
MAQNYGLGRGLSSLIPQKNLKKDDGLPAESKAAVQSIPAEKNTVNTKEVREIEISRIVPNVHQPRFDFNEEKLAELANSIKQHGIIQPLVVNQKGEQFEIIAGERRFQAAKIAGLNKVPAIIRKAEEKEKLELAIVENVQRHDLNSLEEAKAYKKLIDEFQMSQEEVAERMGKSRSAVANKVRLLGLPVEIQRALVSGKITEGHAKAILAIANPEKQRALFEMILKDNLTVRQIESKVQEISVRSHNRVVNVDPEIKNLENKLIGALGTKVKITKSGKGGRIIIDYYSQEDLDSVLNKIVSA